MAALTGRHGLSACVFLFFVCVWTMPVRGAETAIDRWSGMIGEASARFGVPGDWIRAVMAVESAGQTGWLGRPIVSPAGAMGLMQLMPDTWTAMRVRYGLGGDPFDPHDNIAAGAAYLRELYDRFGYPDLFAAYNAGPQRLAAYRSAGTPLPAETQVYLARLGAPAFQPATHSVPRGGDSLFFPLGPAAPGLAAPGPAATSPRGLFVVIGRP